MRTSLVTGATGFTGSHLVQRLVSSGENVRLLVRREPGERFAHLESVIGDLRDVHACREATEGVHTVYHIAAAYRDPSLKEKDYAAVNYHGSINLFQAAAANRVRRFVHCSTVGVHGEIIGPPADEEAPFSPGDLYQESKVATEKFLAQHGSDMEIVVFRPTGIYGPGDLRLLKFIRLIAKGRSFLIGDGTPRYHLTYIDDLVDGIVLCGKRSEAIGQVFILGGPSAPTLNEWAHIVAELLGVSPPRLHLPVWPFMAAAAMAEAVFPPLGLKPPIFRRRMDFFTKNRAFSIQKARQLLGYAPSVDVREGMEWTIAWYRQAELI